MRPYWEIYSLATPTCTYPRNKLPCQLKNTHQKSALLLVDLGERWDLCEPGVVLDGLVLQLREAPHAQLGHAGLVVGEVLRGPSINDVRKGTLHKGRPDREGGRGVAQEQT